MLEMLFIFTIGVVIGIYTKGKFDKVSRSFSKKEKKKKRFWLSLEKSIYQEKPKHERGNKQIFIDILK